MNNIKPFTFTCDKNPKPVFWKRDILSYYIAKGFSPIDAQVELEKSWVANEAVVVLNNEARLDAPANEEPNADTQDAETQLDEINRLFEMFKHL